jgi:exodeoxyribonuclease VII large subunit
VILLARGGGSLEDLWEFNEESVVRAIVGSRIPIVTGVGHEIDVSIADLVADYHAHTPTEAAQVVTTYWRLAPQLLDSCAIRLGQTLRRLVETSRHRLNGIERHEVFRRPMDWINMFRQLLDDQQRQSILQIQGLVLKNRQRLDRLAMRLADKHPRHRLELETQRLGNVRNRLLFSMRSEFERRQQRLDALRGHLSAIAPEQVLRRGYSITRLKKTGRIVRSAVEVKTGDRLTTQLADSQIESTASDALQPELFE